MSTSTQDVKPDSGGLEKRHKRQRRWGGGKTVGAVGVVAAIGLAAVASSILGALGEGNPTTPAAQVPTVAPVTSREVPGFSVTDQVPVGSVPKVDYVIDLNTGVMTPLPRAIIRSVAKPAEMPLPRYAASPDGSLLAYVGTGDNGSRQIFIAGIDGSGIRQLTPGPLDAWSPAWSPDGTKIAYEGHSSEGVRNLFVLDVATGESTPIADARRVSRWAEPQFTPDGSSLLYTDAGSSYSVLRTVPINGGKSTVLIGRGEGMGYAGRGSLSPDGSLVTMMGNEIGGPGALRFVANADGTELRSIPLGGSNPAGTWSPDGNRIVCSDFSGKSIIVVDVAMGDASRVAKGSTAIWLNRHTLLVEVWPRRGR
jgi:Tol biopolymer transport system component